MEPPKDLSQEVLVLETLYGPLNLVPGRVYNIGKLTLAGRHYKYLGWNLNRWVSRRVLFQDVASDLVAYDVRELKDVILAPELLRFKYGG